MRRPIATALLLSAVTAAPALAADPKARTAPVKDSSLGLSRTSVFDVPSPPAYRAEDAAPAEKPPPKRLSAELPPVIPHAVSDFLPITREQNACIDCHELPGPKRKGEPTPLPRSHFVDWRHDQGKPLEKHAGARWVCTACHVTSSDAAPLVGNRFRP